MAKKNINLPYNLKANEKKCDLLLTHSMWTIQVSHSINHFPNKRRYLSYFKNKLWISFFYRSI